MSNIAIFVYLYIYVYIYVYTYIHIRILRGLASIIVPHLYTSASYAYSCIQKSIVKKTMFNLKMGFARTCGPQAVLISNSWLEASK